MSDNIMDLESLLTEALDTWGLYELALERRVKILLDMFLSHIPLLGGGRARALEEGNRE